MPLNRIPMDMVDGLTSNLAENVKLVRSIDDFTTNLTQNYNMSLLDGTYTLSSSPTSMSSNILIEGQNNAILDGGLKQLNVSGVQNVEFRNVTFQNFFQLQFVNPVNLTFRNCTFKNFSINGVLLTNFSNVKFIECSWDTIGSSTVTNTSQGMGIYANGGDTLIVRESELQKTYGNGAIFILGVTNCQIKRNRIHDTAYRGIDFYGSTPSTGYIEDNDIWNCGSMNATASGVGCNGIYSSSDTSGVKVSQNRITSAIENGIEGQYYQIVGNIVDSTGVDQTNHPTPSIDGIYPYPLNSGTTYIENNIIRNSAGSGIKYYSASTINNMSIINNIIEDSSLNSAHYGVEINSGTSYNNVTIQGNISRNKNRVIYLNNKPCTNVYENGNKAVEGTLNVSNVATVKTSDGVEYNAIQNKTFSSWASSTTLNNWAIANGTLSQVVDGNSYIPQITVSGGYSAKITQDIVLPKGTFVYYLKVTFKGNTNIVIRLTPYNVDGTLNSGGAISLTSTSFSTTDFQEFTYMLSTPNKVQLYLGTVSSTANDYVIIQSVSERLIRG